MNNNLERHSILSFVSDGETTQFNISFDGGYINQDNIKAYAVSINEDTQVQTELEVLDLTFLQEDLNEITGWKVAQVEINKVVEEGKTIYIYRDTPVEKPLVEYEAGSVLTKKNLDLQNKQNILSIAEIKDSLKNFQISLEGSLENLQRTENAIEEIIDDTVGEINQQTEDTIAQVNQALQDTLQELESNSQEVIEQIKDYSNTKVINTTNPNYTISSQDAYGFIRYNGLTEANFNMQLINPDLNFSFSKGSFVSVIQVGIENVNINTDNINLQIPGGCLPKTRAQNSIISLTCVDDINNTWVISGDLALEVE